MALSDDYRPRLSIVLTEDQRRRLSKLLPWGTGRVLFSAIVDEIIELLEHHGMAAAGLIISKKASLLELMIIKEDGDAALRSEAISTRNATAGSNSTSGSDKTEPKTVKKGSRKSKKGGPQGL